VYNEWVIAGVVIATTAQSIFDPRVFLATVRRGLTASDVHQDGVVFQRSAAADAVERALWGPR
jgi:hypothetical protein